MRTSTKHIITACLAANAVVNLASAQDEGGESVGTLASSDTKEAIDCFTETVMYGDQDENHYTTTDMDKLS